MSREGGTVCVVPGTACESAQNRPPRTKTPSRYQITLRRCLRERVAGVSTRSGGCIRLWGVEMLREGGTVRVVPEGARGGVQNRPPRTKSPSRNRNTLQRGEGDKNTLPVQDHPPAVLEGACSRCFYSLWRVYSSLGGWKCCGRVELFALCLKGLVGVCRIALHGQNRPPARLGVTKSPSRYQNILRRRLRAYYGDF